MPNHVHLLCVPRAEESLAKALGRAHREYACLINGREDCRGHLWQERFYSCLTDADHAVAAARYIELNPVRAGLVADPGEYRW
jgi:putative transposase